MDKSTRNAIERATQQARKLLDDDLSSQLEGTFDVLRSGVIAPIGGVHLSGRQQFQRGRIVAAIEHKRASGMTALEAVADYVRDAAFTTLNRFIALKMLEARGLVQECITKGEQSAGYREFCGMAPGLALIPDAAGYRLYVESLFDEFSTEIKVLFDRRDVATVLWPRRQTFEGLLTILNAPELGGVWGEDETIGWVYQFFNSGEERRKMRVESQAPRNSRELAVRNQFFTPRYVVQFLVDNTLGRVWLEMHGEPTRVTELCEYSAHAADEPSLTRARKDPRDLRILDPACGSGHFLLYSFDLLLAIYEEAWAADGVAPRCETTGRPLREDFPDLVDLRRAAPRLIVEHNLYGIDIDPRCAQIAALALWLRAQRAWKDLGVTASNRPRVRRTHIVVAESMPGDAALVDEFAARLDPPLFRDLFKKMVGESHLAGELGALLRVENGIAAELHRAREQFVKLRQTPGFLPGLEPLPQQGALDLSGIDDDRFFQEAETLIVDALRQFAETAPATASVRRRLFSDDASQGIALVDLLRTRFDAVLMNPPFGEPSNNTRQLHKSLYPDAADNLAVSFVIRGVELLAHGGSLGVIADCSWQTKFDYSAFRRRVISDGLAQCVVDLGWGVLDANVETSVAVFSADRRPFLGWRCPTDSRSDSLKSWASGTPSCDYALADFADMPNAILAYEMPRTEFSAYKERAFLPTSILRAVAGIKSCDSSADFRLWWEVSPSALAIRSSDSDWRTLHNGSPYCPFHYPPLFAVRAKHGFRELLSRGGALPGAAYYGKPGCAYGKRTDQMYAYLRGADEVFSQEGQALFPVGDASQWEVLALCNSSSFARHANYVSGQHKYHNYINLIALSKIRDTTATAAARAAHVLLSQLDLSNELAADFAHPGACAEFELDVDPSIRTLRKCERMDSVLALQIKINEEFALAEVDCNPPQPTDYYAAYFGRPFSEELVQAIWISWATGCAFGRWGAFSNHSILADDPGTASDITSALLAELPGEHFQYEALRDRLRTSFFSEHLAQYSRSRRKAPVYWQLATTSASYSVWLYIHEFTKDTLYRVQNDFVGPKLVHEERRLDALRQEVGAAPKAAERKTLAVQEEFVEELRTLLEETKRVAPLWNPNLDDGVTICFAPLWRLVSHHKRWQGELKSTWDALCAEELEWTNTSMHFWPQRVIPKCATDRSLAIAHGLDDIFWVEDQDGKWKQRSKPTRSVGELVLERTSVAVKDALKELIGASTPAKPKARTRRSSS